MKKFLLGVLAVLLLGSDSPKGYENARTGMDALQGSWLTVAGELNGMAFTVAGQTETLREGKYTTTNTKDAVIDRGTYRVNLTRKPGLLEETPGEGPRKGTTIRYIVQLDGDLLKIAYRGNTTEPPNGFDEADITILTCKRVKK